MNEIQDNLSWLAFRYVANELDAAEASEFESLLITDQAAREAVAKAVGETTRLRNALAQTAVITANSERTRWNRQTSRVAVVTAGSCLTLVLAICLIRSSLPNSTDVTHQTVERDSSLSPALLAYAWAEARDDWDESESSENAEQTESLESLLNAAIDSESDASLVAPQWMLAALAKMDGGPDDEPELQE